ncbi:radical SAM protein [Streptomyces sp. NPDC059755]|uniref:radical SAM protein n=1 Tax=Streptomyces sp. NPDC059755 TaxID=3346934 RepID=UPI0036623DFE
MIGTRLDGVDAPRLIKSKHGWWFIGNQTWTLLKPGAVHSDGTVREDIDSFLRASGAYMPRTPESFALTVLTTTACNLGCGYCFQNTALDPAGGHQPPRIDRQRLDTDTIDRIIRFTADRMMRVGLKSLSLMLFGGEPLLNRRGCLELLDGARTIGMQTATMTTNGLLLTPDIAKSLNAAGLDRVQVTFDGSRQDHDKIRVKQSGGATFNTIVRNLARATEVTDFRWEIRVNVSHHNFDRIDELFEQLKGQVDATRCTVAFAWVGDAGFGYENSLRHVDHVSARFASWNVAALEAGFQVMRPTMKTTCQICSVPGGTHGAVVNADGALYSCWQSAGKRGFDVGTIDLGYMDVSQIRDRWVTCGYEYERTSPAVAAEFQDLVDGQVLDHLYAAGRL